jgi:hypothetical protein
MEGVLVGAVVGPEVAGLEEEALGPADSAAQEEGLLRLISRFPGAIL